MTNNSNALDMAEDIFLTRALTQGMIDARTAAKASNRAELMAMSAKKIDEQAATIKALQSQLNGLMQRAELAEQEIIRLREKNAESVAVANSAALTLRETVRILVSNNGGSEDDSNYFLRTLRTKNYHSQVERLLADGSLKNDPRRTSLVTERAWYESPSLQTP